MTQVDNLPPEILAANALRHIARDERVKDYIENDPVLFPILLRAAKRYIGGSSRSECLTTVARLNAAGHAATVDYMGESTRSEEKAATETREFLELIADIARNGLRCSVSLDLSHIGLVAAPGLALQNARTIAEAARDIGAEMMISMEASDRTDSILEVYRQLCREFDNVGITLQARLFRTAADLDAALSLPGKIRLVKGAYEEPAEMAMPRESPELAPTYVLYAKQLLEAGHKFSIGTHDPAIHEILVRHIEQNKLHGGTFEFEVLFGLGDDQIAYLKRKNFSTRIYVVYGREWFLYVCQRIAEQPARLYQALSDAVGHPEGTEEASQTGRSSLFPHR